MRFLVPELAGAKWQRVLIGALVVVSVLPAGAASSPKPAAAEPKVDFAAEVRPILSAHCFKCHGMDEGARKANLRLDVREEAIRPAKSDEVPIVPGKPEASALVRRIFAENEDDLMPPPGAKRPLSDHDKNLLKRWIAEGAEYKPHWAFVAPRQAPLPKVREKNWPQNDLDYFVLARLEKAGLKPSPRADKYTLARRVYLDLTGLPPSPTEADAFVNDASPAAFERLLDKLLASPHYGERWARRWLDLARYADTNGYEKDRPRSIWPWRDWVINALNADLPFDQFTIDQLAGDLLPNASTDQLVATGFHRNSMINEEGGIDTLEYRFLSMVDRVHVTATSWLGLTMACAQCHTHKYDPIPHAEYYRFLACLNNADEPVMEIQQPDIVAKREQIQKQVESLEAALPDKFPVEIKAGWQTPGMVEFSAEHGSEAELLSDGSFLVGGANPDKETYTLKYAGFNQRVTHVQVEAIPDEKIANGGPGRNDSGNFVLSELEMEVLETGGAAEPAKVKFVDAQADYAQEGFPEANAIDGKSDTGWAIGGPGGGHKHRHALFTLAQPLELKNPALVTVRLVQKYGSHHTLGRFRVSFGQQVLDNSLTEQGRREKRDHKFQKWLTEQLGSVANWQKLRPAAVTSSAPTLTIQADDSVFASGDFTKSDNYTLTFRDLQAGVKALRLEMLPDDRLPNHGPGSVNHEGPEGDFWLSTLKVKADGQGVVLTNATESFANGANNAAKAIDDDAQSGWSVSGGQGKFHNAVFQFQAPIAGAKELQVDMLCEKYYAAGLGRFRVWVTTNENAKASPLQNAANDILASHRDPEQIKALVGETGAAADHDLLLREFVRLSPDFAKPRREVDSLRAQMPKFPTTLVLRERPAGNERPTFRQHRGEFMQPRERVTPGVPSFLPPLPDNAPGNRLALAKWLVSGQNPLTSRVVVNRHWEALFGRGLVRTTEDFGFQGELPSHPELLDWLALEFVKQGWSQKKLLKLIVMSATYQQSSTLTPLLRERDPLNILLARGPRLRLEAEMVRDSALAESGLLSEKIGGPSVFPPQPPGVSSEGAYGALEWKTSEGPDRYRRGLYTFAKRTAPYAMTATFDGPSGEACLARRERSDTPLQALTLLNDTVFMECARALGQLAVKAGGDTSSRVELLFRRCLTRPPTAEEKAKLSQFYETQYDRFTKGELKAVEIMDAKDGTDLNEQAAWTAVARVLLNLDETITKS